jgi:hypothetical protein
MLYNINFNWELQRRSSRLSRTGVLTSLFHGNSTMSKKLKSIFDKKKCAKSLTDILTKARKKNKKTKMDGRN